MKPQTGKLVCINKEAYIEDNINNKDILTKYTTKEGYIEIDKLDTGSGSGRGAVIAGDSRCVIRYKEWDYFELYVEPTEKTDSSEPQKGVQKELPIQLPPIGDKSYMMVPQELYDELVYKATCYDGIVKALKGIGETLKGNDSEEHF